MEGAHHLSMLPGYGVVVIVDNQAVIALVTMCRQADILEEPLEAGNDLFESLFVD